MSIQYVRHKVQLHSSPTERNVNPNCRFIMVIDCETTLDFKQELRLAGFSIYDAETETVLEQGFITGLLHAKEKKTLKNYLKKHDLAVYERYDFIKNRLYPHLEEQGCLVNHNIVFDLGCLAYDWTTNENTFFLRLCDCSLPEGKTECELHPSISVRSLNFPKALISVKCSNPNRTFGYIADTMIIGRALLGPGSMSLKDMGNRFKCSTVKKISEEHGETLTEGYLDYTWNDVKATLELYLREIEEYNKHGLDIPICFVTSEASIGKAYLQKAGINPFLRQHEELPEWLTPTAMKCMYGARSEVKCRLKPVLVRYCDFKSQYPLVNGLMNLQRFLTCQYIRVEHKAKEIQNFLNVVTLDDLRNIRVWQKLAGVLVRIAPDGDIVPNKFQTVEHEEKVKGYAVCYTYGQKNWYTLADIVASKLLSGKIPVIHDAVVLYPSGHVDTKKIVLFGDEKYTIDLTKEDFFIRVIDLRSHVKVDLKQSKKEQDYEQADYLESLQLALKLLANSTSYGILVETRYEKGTEVAGKFYAAPIGVHITGGARLLLAIAERLGRDRGLNYAMCDTDSMAYCLPEGMKVKHFYKFVDEIVRWFDALNPYEEKGSIFELEDVNFVTYKNKQVNRPLYFLGVSCKRYVLYNKYPKKLDDGSYKTIYKIRKLSAHATGRFSFDKYLELPDTMEEIPYEMIDSTDVDAINGKIRREKFKRWMYALWYRGIEQAEQGIIAIEIPDEEWSNQIVRYQEAISTPGKLKSHAYLGVRPYSFFLEFPACGEKGERYIMPFKSTHKDILTVQPFIAGIKLFKEKPRYDTLRNRFSEFFSHEETKAQDGYKTGLLERRTLHVEQLAERTRTGKTIEVESNIEQPELFTTNFSKQAVN